MQDKECSKTTAKLTITHTFYMVLMQQYMYVALECAVKQNTFDLLISLELYIALKNISLM